MTPEIDRIAGRGSRDATHRRTSSSRPIGRLIVFCCFLPVSNSFGGDQSPLPAASVDPAEVKDVLSVVPADSSMVIAVRDLAEFDAKLSRLADRLASPVSPYRLAKRWLEIVVGIDDHGPAAIAVVPAPPDSSASVDRGVILVLPTSDIKDMLTFLSPQPIEGGLFKTTLRGREGYAAAVGQFTVFGSDLSVVRSVARTTKTLADRASEHQLAQYAANDVALWIDPQAIALPVSSATRVPWLRDVLKRYGSRVADLRSIQIAARVEQGGVNLELCIERSPAARRLVGTDTADSLLRGLLDEPYVVAIGLDAGPGGRMAKAVGELFAASRAFAPILDSAKGVELLNAVDIALGNVVGVALSVSVLPPSTGGRLGVAMVLRTAGDGQTLLAKVDAIVSSLKSGPFVDPVVNRALEKLEYLRSVETVEDVTIDHVAIETSGINDVDDDSLQKVFGREGLLLRIGVVDERNVVLAFGGGLERFAKIVRTVREGASPLALDTGTAMSALGVARERSLEAYVSVDRGLGLIQAISSGLGHSTGYLRVPETNAPVAFAMHTVNASSIQLDLFVPAELLIAVKTAMSDRAALQASPAP